MQSLISRIQQGENQHLDFKKTIQDSRKIARSLVAFANSRGGSLLIGVKDNGSIAGIRSEEEIHMIEVATLLYCHPKLPYTCITHSISGKTVLEVQVAPMPQTLWKAQDEQGKWQVWLRQQYACILAPGDYITLHKALSQSSPPLLQLDTHMTRMLSFIAQQAQGISSRDLSEHMNLSRNKTLQMCIQACRLQLLRFEPCEGRFYSV
jgi:predicted HTH transcriptional regulator